MRPADRDTQHPGQVSVVQAVPPAELGDLALVGIEPAEGIQHQVAQLVLTAVGGPGHGHRRGQLATRVRPRRPGPGAQPALAFVPRDGIQPRPQPGRAAQPGQLGGGDDERVLHGIGGVSGLAQ
jgi:hypothetical protein